VPNRSYQKGTRFENKILKLLTRLGECTRSFMSRGADLTLTFSLRKWSVSCKCGKPGKIGYSAIKRELETYDICVTSEDRDPYPMVHLYMPKFLEMMGDAEALDFAELNKSEAA
jgi:hypothetical protein